MEDVACVHGQYTPSDHVYVVLGWCALLILFIAKYNILGLSLDTENGPSRFLLKSGFIIASFCNMLYICYNID